MSVTDLLIILGCLAGGYWIVSNVMGPGIDITRRKPPEANEEERPRDPSAARNPTPARNPASTRNPPSARNPASTRNPPAAQLPPAVRLPPAHKLPSWRGAPPSQPRPSSRTASGVNDWRIILDVPNTATRSDIEAAFRHQQKKAQAAGDTLLLQRLQQARDAGLASLRSGQG